MPVSRASAYTGRAIVQSTSTATLRWSSSTETTSKPLPVSWSRTRASQLLRVHSTCQAGRRATSGDDSTGGRSTRGPGAMSISDQPDPQCGGDDLGPRVHLERGADLLQVVLHGVRA